MSKHTHAVNYLISTDGKSTQKKDPIEDIERTPYLRIKAAQKALASASTKCNHISQKSASNQSPPFILKLTK